MEKIDFFIIGAPKSGTTALASYLDNHEDIYITDPKEPSYFADDVQGFARVSDTQQYLNLFKNTCTSPNLGFYPFSQGSSTLAWSSPCLADCRLMPPLPPADYTIVMSTGQRPLLPAAWCGNLPDRRR